MSFHTYLWSYGHTAFQTCRVLSQNSTRQLRYGSTYSQNTGLHLLVAKLSGLVEGAVGTADRHLSGYDEHTQIAEDRPDVHQGPKTTQGPW